MGSPDCDMRIPEALVLAETRQDKIAFINFLPNYLSENYAVSRLRKHLVTYCLYCFKFEAKYNWKDEKSRGCSSLCAGVSLYLSISHFMHGLGGWVGEIKYRL